MEKRSTPIALGALGGATSFLALFGIDLLGTPIDFMGFSADARAKGIIFGRYGAHIVFEQLKIVAAYLVLGALFGIAAVWLTTLAGRGDDEKRAEKGRRFTEGAIGAWLVHALAMLASLRHYPQLYTELLYDRGGFRKILMSLAVGPRSGLIIGAALAAPILRVGWRARSAFLRPRAIATAIGFAGALLVGAWLLAPPKMRLNRLTELPSGAAAPPRAGFAASPDRPNVLLLAVDSLRADRLFGPGAARFPNLARLAAKAVRFHEAHVTVPRTFPSWTTLLTGRFPYHHGIRHMFPSAAERGSIGRTLPTALSELGYQTAVVSDYAGEIFSRTPYGFHIADAPRFDMRSIVDQRGLQVHANLLPYATTPFGARVFPVVDLLPERTDPELLVERAIAHLHRIEKNPFFLTVFFSTAHFPYSSPAPYYSRYAAPGYDGPYRFQKPPLTTTPIGLQDATQIRALYDGAIASVDHAIGELLDELERSGHSSDTLIVLLADHGENLYDVEGRGMGHGDHLLGDAADHIPLLIIDPRPSTQAPHDTSAIVRDVDLAPTLAARLGARLPDADGVDLAPLLIGRERTLGLHAFGETEFWFTSSGPGFMPGERLPYPDITGVTDLDADDDIYLKTEWRRTIVAAKHRSIRTEQWKLLYRPTRSGVLWSLYDLGADPLEKTDVASQHPDVVRDLKQALGAWIAHEPDAVVAGEYVLPGPNALFASDGPKDAASLPKPTLPLRLLPYLGHSSYVGPSLSRAWERFKSPAKIVSPHSGLRGREIFREVVPTFGTPWGQKRPSDRTDPIWNRLHGAYRAERSLFVPTSARYLLSLPGGAHGTFTADAAVPLESGETTFEIGCDKQVIKQITLDGRRDGARWHPFEVPLDCDGALTIATRASGGASEQAAFLGDPWLRPRTPRERTNLLFIVIDTLRADAARTMPALSKFGARAIDFTQAITAATWTRPSLLGIFGGDLPSSVGQSAEVMIPSDTDRRRFYQVSPSLLPRTLANAGFQSVAIGNNFFLLGHPRIGLDFGFDRVSDLRHPQLDTPAIADEAIAFFGRAADPWFLYLHFDGPHWPYAPPPQFSPHGRTPADLPADSEMGKYLAEAAYSDFHLARVLDGLARSPAKDRTIVVIVGDHGEIFDHAHAHTVDALGFPTLHHHGWSAYDEIARVPLYLSAPGLSPRKIDSQVSLIDLEPTIRELLGLPIRPNQRGRSLVPLLRGAPGAESNSRPAFVEGQNVRLLRDGGWAYLRRTDGRVTLPDGKHVDRPEELYDLSADPRQHQDLAQTRPIELARMRAEFDRLAPKLPALDLPLLHVRAGDGLGKRNLVGTISSSGSIEHKRVQNVGPDGVRPSGPHTLEVNLPAGALLDLVVYPSDSTITFSLRAGDQELTPADVRLGEFALPLLLDGAGAAARTMLAALQLAWLDAPRAPPPSGTDLMVVWRDPQAATGVTAPESDAANDEVAGMMQRWGYSQPEAAKP